EWTEECDVRLSSPLQGSYPVWDDFISKASKLQAQLRTTVVAVVSFLDAFQKVADLAAGSRGGTRDIGSALTRMCMRHRSIEAKLRQVFVDCLINPLQEQMEEWKRVANSLDKDHAREYKKARQEIKRRSSDTLKLQKKARKGSRFQNKICRVFALIFNFFTSSGRKQNKQRDVVIIIRFCSSTAGKSNDSKQLSDRSSSVLPGWAGFCQIKLLF
uniref:IMD domain-containing protein n=1 Tax=Salarias fasciatus TaxID=181472 RepID=A0A672FXC1_SALFA